MNAPRITFIGPLPPPTHGQGLATQALRAALEASGFVLDVVDTGGGRGGRTATTARRLLAHARAGAAVLAGRGWVYLSANSNAGLWATALLGLAARLRGRPVMIHHHSYAPARTPLPAMRRLARWAGPEAIHLVLCATMAADLRRVNPGVRETLVLNNAGLVDGGLKLQRRDRVGGRVTFGHLSNLCAEKGVLETVQVVEALAAAGEDVALVLAGPVQDETARRAIERATEALPGRFRYVGPVYGADKAAWFGEVDAFLFPTKYKNEAAPLVVLEAMASGAPAVATACSCIPEEIAETGGCAVALDDMTAACLELSRTIRAGRKGAAVAARARFETLLAAHQAQREAVVAALAGRRPVASNAASCG